MSRSISIAAVVIGFVALLAAPAEAAVKVYLLAGQSNMVGCGAAGTVKAPYKATQPGVQIWKSNDSGWTSLSPSYYNTNDLNVGSNSSTYSFAGRFGPEVAFGYTMDHVFPDDEIYIIKFAKDGTTLAYDWNPTFPGDCYATFKNRADAALANLTAAGKSYTIEGMLWMQGESDGMLGSYEAVQYGTRLTDFINQVRSDFSTPDMDFVFGRITTKWYEDCPAVRACQEIVATEMANVRMVNTDDLPTVSSTNYHYNTTGQVTLGLRFADALLVPEPSTFLLLGAGMVALAGIARRARRTSAGQ